MPPLPADATPRPPSAFANLLATGKEPLVLVGGQAVNLWALYYEAETMDLAPFVSRDVDVLGDREILTAIGFRAGAKPQFFPMKPPSNEVGVVIARDEQGLPLLIEVLRHVHGITNEELKEPLYTFAIEGTNVRAPGPIALLKAKLANVADLAQNGRQDARHVCILARLLPAYFHDLERAVLEERTEERALIRLLERLVAIVTDEKSAKVLSTLEIDPHGMFRGLGKGGTLEKVNSFLMKRLPRLFK